MWKINPVATTIFTAMLAHCHHIDLTCYTLKVMLSHLLLALLLPAVTIPAALVDDSKDKVLYSKSTSYYLPSNL